MSSCNLLPTDSWNDALSMCFPFSAASWAFLDLRLSSVQGRDYAVPTPDPVLSNKGLMASPLGELELSGTSFARDLCPSAFSFGASRLFWTFFALVSPSLHTVVWVTFTLSCVSISYSPCCVGTISKRRRGVTIFTPAPTAEPHSVFRSV